MMHMVGNYAAETDAVWNPNKYANSLPPSPQGPYRKRRPRPISPKPQPVFDHTINPVEDLGQLYDDLRPLPSRQQQEVGLVDDAMSDLQQLEAAYAADYASEHALSAQQPLECRKAFASKWVDDNTIASKEQMEMNMAQRHIVPAGAGVAADSNAVPIPSSRVGEVGLWQWRAHPELRTGR